MIKFPDIRDLLYLSNFDGNMEDKELIMLLQLVKLKRPSSTLLDIPMFWFRKTFKRRVLKEISGFFLRNNISKLRKFFNIPDQFVCCVFVPQSLALKAYIFIASNIYTHVNSVMWFFDLGIQFKSCALYQTEYWIIYLIITNWGWQH